MIYCNIPGVFIALGLSGVVPAMHYVSIEGFSNAINFAALGWLCLMALLYIVGALIYAFRIPERIFPGKFDIWVRMTNSFIFAIRVYLRQPFLFFLSPIFGHE